MKGKAPGWLAGVLLLVAASAAVAEEEVAWGRAVNGLRLGLAVALGSGPLPSELVLEVLVRNPTSEPRLLPVSACGTLRWPSFAVLKVGAGKGLTYRFHVGSRLDIASVHPHEQVRIEPGETLRERFSLQSVALHNGLRERDAALWPRLLEPRQVTLQVELESGAKGRRLASGRLKHRFGLSSTRAPEAGGRCVAGVEAGGSAACALLGDGTPWCWGSLPPGLPGNAKETDVARPQPLPLLAGSIVELGLAGGMLCARTSEGSVYCAGGQPGGTGALSAAGGHPLRVRHLEGAVHLFLGRGEQCARVEDGSLACWGMLHAPVPPSEVFAATRPEALRGGVAEVALGQLHACALRGDGGLWCWGANERDQLGTGDSQPRKEPVHVPGLGKEGVSVAAGASHTCAATREGSLWCWGRSEYGALGLGRLKSSPVPAAVSTLGNVVRVAAGHHQTCAWKRDGSVWCFGEVLRDAPPRALALEPVRMKELGTEVEEVVFGVRHACARTAGEVFCWGEGTLGQLGNGDTGSYNSPPVRVPLPGGKAVSLTAGDSFTCALTEDGSAWCWGNGFAGELGTGRKASSSRPARVRLPCPGQRSGG